MADPTEITTLAEVKAYLHITSADFDAILTSIKASVEKFVMNYCRDPFLHATYTEYYDGNGLSFMPFRHYPITAVTEINIDSDRDFDTATEIDSDSIIDTDNNKAAGVIELFDEVFTAGLKNVKVVYTAGYVTLPADLKHAVQALCAREFLIQDKQLMGVTSQNVADKTISLNLEDIPRNVWLILQSYRRAMV